MAGTTEVYGQVKGTLAAKSTTVTDAAANLVGDFSGDAALNFVSEKSEWVGQDFLVKESIVTVARASMNFGLVAFQPNKYATIFGITITVNDTKETTPVSASYITFDSDWTGPAQLEYMATSQRKNDTNKKFQVHMLGQASGDLSLQLGHGKYLAYGFGVDAILDSSNDLFTLIFEQ